MEWNYVYLYNYVYSIIIINKSSSSFLLKDAVSRAVENNRMKIVHIIYNALANSKVNKSHAYAYLLVDL